MPLSFFILGVTMKEEHSWKIGDTSQYDYLSDVPVRQTKSDEVRRLNEPCHRKTSSHHNTSSTKINFWLSFVSTSTRHIHSTTHRNRFQATEFIIDSGHGMGFALGNVMKYAQPLRKKKTDTIDRT
jgi:hypothetical protein